MFDGFKLAHIQLGEVRLRVRYGGSGSPVLLLHGHPRTHATWHRVAPALAKDHFVVCPDLRGYGQSSKPPTTPNHSPYSKRAMAGDCVALMERLTHDRFAVVGHDRGCYVAQRAALDHPRQITHLTVLDGVPIGEALARCDAGFASTWWHWFFYAQTAKPAERYISQDPDSWYRASPDQMGNEAFEDYQRAIHDPETVHAMMEDYRAGLGIDRELDDADKAAGRRIACPVQVLWASRDDMVNLYGNPLEVWRGWADNVCGKEIESGHHIAEEAPEALIRELQDFLPAAKPRDHSA